MTCRATVSPDDVELLRRELVAAVSQAAPAGRTPGAAPEADEPPPAPRPEAAAAARKAGALLDQALASGVWRDQDALALGGLMAMLEPADVESTVGRLSRAISERQVRLLTRGAPF